MESRFISLLIASGMAVIAVYFFIKYAASLQSFINNTSAYGIA